MKNPLNVLGRLTPSRAAAEGRGWPSYLFGGRVRTSTMALILVFLLVWWTYDTYHPPPKTPQAPQVVPPGFIPDPNYTWVPRTRLQQPPGTVTQTITVTPTPETTTPTTEPSPSVLPPPWPLPCPPLCPPSAPAPSPTSAPSAATSGRAAPPATPTTPSPLP